MTKGTTAALTKLGIKEEKNKFLINLEKRMINKQETNVAKVPNIWSRIPKPNAKLDK